MKLRFLSLQLSPGRPAWLYERNCNLNGTDSKTVSGGSVARGFESLPLRFGTKDAWLRRLSRLLGLEGLALIGTLRRLARFRFACNAIAGA
jgi:hypothetical protein